MICLPCLSAYCLHDPCIDSSLQVTSSSTNILSAVLFILTPTQSKDGWVGLLFLPIVPPSAFGLVTAHPKALELQPPPPSPRTRLPVTARGYVTSTGKGRLPRLALHQPLHLTRFLHKHLWWIQPSAALRQLQRHVFHTSASVRPDEQVTVTLGKMRLLKVHKVCQTFIYLLARTTFIFLTKYIDLQKLQTTGEFVWFDCWFVRRFAVETFSRKCVLHGQHCYKLFYYFLFFLNVKPLIKPTSLPQITHSLKTIYLFFQSPD